MFNVLDLLWEVIKKIYKKIYAIELYSSVLGITQGLMWIALSSNKQSSGESII